MIPSFYLGLVSDKNWVMQVVSTVKRSTFYKTFSFHKNSHVKVHEPLAQPAMGNLPTDMLHLKEQDEDIHISRRKCVHEHKTTFPLILTLVTTTNMTNINHIVNTYHTRKSVCGFK